MVLYDWTKDDGVTDVVSYEGRGGGEGVNEESETNTH